MNSKQNKFWILRGIFIAVTCCLGSLQVYGTTRTSAAPTTDHVWTNNMIRGSAKKIESLNNIIESLKEKSENNANVVELEKQLKTFSSHIGDFGSLAITPVLRSIIKNIAKDIPKDIGALLAKVATSTTQQAFLNPKMWFTGIFPIALALGLFVIVPTCGFFGTRYLYKILENQLKNPSFIAETNHKTLLKKLLSQEEKVPSMDEFVAPKNFKNKLINFIAQLRTLTTTDAQTGMMALFYGSYGVGKTFAAKIVAHAAGLKYAVVRCSTIRQNKEFARMLAEKLSWARKNKILLILDEAEELLGTQQDNSLDRMVVDELIGLLGTPEKRPHMIIMTNHPHLLNPAFVGDGGRINKFFKFPVPDMETVCELLRQNINKQLKALHVKIDLGFDLPAATQVVGIRPGREIYSIVAEACLQASILNEPLAIRHFEIVTAEYKDSRIELHEFKKSATAKDAAIKQG